MKRSLIEVFKYIDIVTWYSVIRVNKLWLAAGTSNEIVSRILTHPTYEVYLQTKNREHRYFYTTKDILSCMHYDNELLVTVYCAHLLSEHFYKKLELSYEIVNEKGTFIFHKITYYTPILSSDVC